MRRPLVLAGVLLLIAIAAPARSDTYYSNVRIGLAGHLRLGNCPIALHGYEQGCAGTVTFSARPPLTVNLGRYRAPEECQHVAEGHSFPTPSWSIGSCGFGDGFEFPGPIGARLTDEPTPLPGGGCRAWTVEFDETVDASRLFFLVGFSQGTVRSGRIVSRGYQHTAAGDLWLVSAYIRTLDQFQGQTFEVTFELGGTAFSPSSCDDGADIEEVLLTLEGYGTGAWTV